jgi:ABC-type branched-subunit amino acid transport system substrate-binding protein
MKRSVRRGLALGTALALVAVMAACGDDEGSTNGGAPVPGVTDTEILIGSHQPLTGPAAPGYSKIAPASKAYFDYVNANGGVHGRKITYKFLDDTYNPSTTQQVVRQLVLEDKVFALFNGLGTPTHSGVLDFLKTNRVPDLFVASGSLNWNQPDKYPGTFGWQTDYTIEGKIFANYVKNNLAGQKVCHFGQGDDFGRDSVGGVEKILGPTGLVSKQTYVPTNTDVAPQISALKAAGCQVVILATVPGFTALTLGTAARLRFKPQWIVSSVGGDYLTLANRLQAAGTPLLEGLITGGYLPPVQDTSNPWIALFGKVNKDHNGGAPFDGNIVYGMSVAYTLVQALKAAGKDLTRQGIIDAIEKGGFIGPGLTPLQYSKTVHSGYAGLQMARTSGGVQTPFGPVYTSDSSDGAVQEYTEKQEDPPANGVPA